MGLPAHMGCCCTPPTGSWCMSVYIPCQASPGVPSPGIVFTVTPPTGSSFDVTAGSDGRACFTPTQTGLYRIQAPIPSGAAGVTALDTYEYALAYVTQDTYHTYPIASGYWCPCGCTLSARGSTHKFAAFGREQGATLVGDTYYATMTAVQVYDAGGAVAGTTVDVAFEIQAASLCIMRMDYTIPLNGHATNATWFLGSGAAIFSCEPFDYQTVTGAEFTPPPGDTYWPGPTPTGVRFFE